MMQEVSENFEVSLMNVFRVCDGGESFSASLLMDYDGYLRSFIDLSKVKFCKFFFFLN